MKYGSVCSGIEAASVAWHPLGWRAAFLSEIESFPRAVLTHHYPDVPLHGDFTTIEAGQYDAIDLLVGGTPCQSFSVAGLRGGLADDRGNLALEYLRLADRLRPKWLVWENVPGVLSSNGGRDFGAILGGMVELGYGIAYRVLDAQFFGVPQRRRRVFVVGYFGDWRRAAAVLFERHSLQGHPAPRREAGEDVAPTISARPTGGGGLGTDFDCDGGLIASLDLNNMGGGGNIGWHAPSEPSITLDTNANVGIAHSLRAEGFDASEDGTGRGTPLVAFMSNASGANLSFGFDQSPTLKIGGDGGNAMAVMIGSSHASSRQADAYSKLRSLREAIGAEAFAEWGLGISDPFRAPEVLRSDLHGESVRCQANEGGRGLDDGPLSRAARDSGGPVSDVRQAGRERRAPSGRGLSEQFARELEAALSKLSHEGSSTERLLRALRCAGEGAGVLQQALPPIQGRSAVRRVTPREAERLQGFPDDWTLVTHRNKLAADGPRYKALGNSMAVPCMRWIGERIHSVELLTSLREAA